MQRLDLNIGYQDRYQDSGLCYGHQDKMLYLDVVDTQFNESTDNRLHRDHQSWTPDSPMKCVIALLA